MVRFRLGLANFPFTADLCVYSNPFFVSVHFLSSPRSPWTVSLLIQFSLFMLNWSTMSRLLSTWRLQSSTARSKKKKKRDRFIINWTDCALQRKSIKKERMTLALAVVMWGTWTWKSWTKPQVGHLQIHVLLYTRSYTKWRRRRRRTSILFMLLLTVVSILKLSLSHHLLFLLLLLPTCVRERALSLPPLGSFFFTALSLSLSLSLSL